MGGFKRQILLDVERISEHEEKSTEIAHCDEQKEKP